MNAQPPLTFAPVMSERRVSFLGALLVGVGPISMALYTPAMPQIVEAFGTTEAAVKLTLSVYFAGFAAAQLVCGPLSDGLGRRPVTIGFMVIYFLASMLALFAPDVGTLIVARFLQGIGAAVGVAIARAIVRDLFTSDRSARVMNIMGIIIAVGPALAPTIGGITMELAGWHAIFIIMAVVGVAIVLAAIFAMKETVVRDLSRLRPRAVVHSYRTLLTSPYFLSSSLFIAFSVGAIYAQSTMLPFILMDRVGLTPTHFGLAMLAQSGAFLTGSIIVSRLLRRFGAFRLIPFGLAFLTTGSLLLGLSLWLVTPQFITVMGPIAVFSFGMAFTNPAMNTAVLAPFPHMAGAAAALSGFLQMGIGMLGGVIAALIGAPVLALTIVAPAMGLMTLISWLVWRSLPEPTFQPRAIIDDLPR